MLVAARACQGAFGALLAPAALSLLAVTFSDPAERGRAFGVYGAVAGAGGAVGLLLGGVLTEYLSWRWCLYVNLLFAGGRCGRGSPAAPPPRAGPAKMDLPGAALVSAGMFCIDHEQHRADAPLRAPAAGADRDDPGGGGLALLTRIGVHSSYAGGVLPSLLMMGLDLVFAPVFNTGTFGVPPQDAGVAADRQHRAAARRVVRHLAAQHDLREFRRQPYPPTAVPARRWPGRR